MSDADPADADSVQERAARSVVAVGVRTVVIRAIGFAGALILAPLLGPSNYGVIALGLTVIVFGKFLADGGLVPGFIRREEAPTHHELEGIMALQLAVAMVLTLAAAAIAAPRGEGGVAILVMTSSLLIDAWRVPTVVDAERRLSYGRLVRAEVLEVVVYNVFAVGLVLAGFGVMGGGIATVLKSVSGTAMIVAGGHVGLIAPVPRVRVLLPTARFGLFFQLAWLSTLARDQGLNVLLVALSGTSALGAWALARRLLAIVELLFQSAWRVALPGMARLIEAGVAPRGLLARSLSVAATSIGFPVVLLVGTDPALVPALFGDDWTGTQDALPWVCAGFMLAIPLGTALTSLLWATDEARKVFVMGVPSVVATLAVAAVLIPSLGAEAAGIGMFAGALVYLAGSAWFARDVFGREAFSALAPPSIAAGLASAAGWLVAGLPQDDWLGALAGGTVALALYVLMLLAVDRSALFRLFRIIGRALAPATASLR